MCLDVKGEDRDGVCYGYVERQTYVSASRASVTCGLVRLYLGQHEGRVMWLHSQGSWVTMFIQSFYSYLCMKMQKTKQMNLGI